MLNPPFWKKSAISAEYQYREIENRHVVQKPILKILYTQFWRKFGNSCRGGRSISYMPISPGSLTIPCRIKTILLPQKNLRLVGGDVDGPRVFTCIRITTRRDIQSQTYKRVPRGPGCLNNSPLPRLREREISRFSSRGRRGRWRTVQIFTRICACMFVDGVVRATKKRDRYGVLLICE